MRNTLDIFYSYARGDDDDGWVARFINSIDATFRQLTGQAPRIFVDRESLLTADIWDTKIRSALEASQVVIAVVSPLYVCSEWCRREWMLFCRRETELRQQQLLGDEQGLIFPILLFPLDRGRFNAKQQTFAALIKKRQWLDVSSRVEGNPIRPDHVRLIAEQLIDTIGELEQRRRRPGAAFSGVASGTTIRDPASGLEWSASLSPMEMSFKAALKYASKLSIGGLGGWRLPTRQELETIVDPTALVKDPEASPFPLREPFNAQRSGYLHSGTLVAS